MLLKGLTSSSKCVFCDAGLVSTEPAWPKAQTHTQSLSGTSVLCSEPQPVGRSPRNSCGERLRPRLTPSSAQLPPSSLRESTNMNNALVHFGAVFHAGGFLITVTIMSRKALFHVHSSVWATFGFWLIFAYLMCKGGFFSKQFHYLAVLVTLKTQVNYN